MSHPAAPHRSFPKQTQLASQSTLSLSALCPCQASEALGKSYGECCAPWHQGLFAQSARHAPTPQALMRSRYSAYALRLPAYLLATWHGSTAPGEIDFPPTRWLGLEVKHTEARGDVGVVEFVARYRDSTGRASRLHEISRFVREGKGEAAHWLYIDGQPPDESA